MSLNAAHKLATEIRPAPSDVSRTSLTTQLERVDWNFPERRTHSDIEGLHPYPAKFITELPRELLRLLPIPHGTAVLDPFCGSGSTLVECQRRGLSSIGIDLNPIACLITRVKTTPIADRWSECVNRVMLNALSIKKPKVPSIPNLDHWFAKPIQEALAILLQAIAEAPAAHRDFLRLTLSSIIVRVSNQDSDTRYAAVEKNLTPDDVFLAFTKAAQRNGHALLRRDYPLTPATVIAANTLTIKPTEIAQPIGLVVTSPPYPNAYEYWLYHKYRMWWLGLDPLAVKESEIGARAHFFKKAHHTPEDFERQMLKTLTLLTDVMIPGGYVCFVVGRSKIHGRIIDNASVIEAVGIRVGFQRVFSAERALSANRKSFNLSHANIKKETVLVLRFGEGQCA